MIVKQPIAINFAQGLDTKTDPKQVQVGKFLQLNNTVFNKGGLLQKRNGYGQLMSLPNTDYSYLTTFNGNLTAVGDDIAAYNTAGASWIPKGNLQPLSLSTLPIIRNNLNQTACDSVVAPNGVICTVYLETNGSTTTNKYVIADSVTGQNIIAPAVIPVTSGTVSGGMRVFVLGNYFVLVFTNTISASPHLQYVAISITVPTVVTTNADIASGYAPATTLSWDGYVADGHLYVAYDTTTGGQSVHVVYLTQTLISTGSGPITSITSIFTGFKATMMSVTADIVNQIVFISFYSSSSSTGYTACVDYNLNLIFAPVEIISSGTFLNIASAAQGNVCTVFAEAANTDTNTGLVCNFIDAVTVTRSAFTGTVGSPYVLIRSLGLASKAFISNGVIYLMGVYASPYQTTYFLVNGSLSTAAAPVIAAKLAYENGGGYLTTGLPSAVISDGNICAVSYLYKDLIEAVNKNTNVPSGSQVNGIYSQTGINLATFTIGTQGLDTAEIGGDLQLTGGFLWMYDGYLPVEHNFFLFPDINQTTLADTATWSATGGSMAGEPTGWVSGVPSYYYQFTYEWTDNQGNAFRSAPSIPVPVITSGGAVFTGSVTLNIPTLRLTMKTANPVKIVIYRWSVAQQEYYQTTSISAPLLNSTTTDSVQFIDTNSDATILGNNLLYTTGGVVEDVNAPASNLLAIFDTRLWLVDAEDPNLLWYSKQAIEATPVEMSDLFTLYVPPSTSTEGSTGPITAIFPMDDKLIIFKQNFIYYINGTGPDNTGSNNQYSPVTFVTSTVGCANQNSIALTPSGLMFQSNKGIWILGRGLDVDYIGAPVDNFNSSIVNSAVGVPATNQVRFTLNTGQTLMYDYYYGQWGTFIGAAAVSSCIFQGLHTFINQYGAAYQESPGAYLDGSNPVLMSFQTGPLRLGDLQNYQRAYFFYLLGTYISPHKLLLAMSFDYADSPSQSVIIEPTNYSTPFGSGPSQSPFGQGTPFGGPSSLENWRVFLNHQRCQAFNITMQEVFDPTFGTVAGAGLTLSGLNVICGFKRAFRPIPAAQSIG